MTLVAATRLAFEDPGWGTVEFDLMIFRHGGDVLPEYEVVVE